MTESRTNKPASLNAALAYDDQFEDMEDSKSFSFWRVAFNRILKDRLTMVAITILSIILVASLMAEVINSSLGVDPFDTNLLESLEPPSRTHLLGTDTLGQDQFARLLVAGRISMAISFFGSVFTLVIGITIGMMAAFFGGIVDDIIMWVINTLSSIPALFLLLIVGAIFQISPFWLTVLFAILGWPFIARLVRSNVYSIREREYILASIALGGSSFYTMFRHIMPNVIPIVIIATARTVGNLMLAEAGLSFLGFGVQPPTPTWGNMLTEAQQYIVRSDARHLIVAPGVMITITVLCMFIIGDGLRDALDPRLKK
ncbi:MAG: ABC transporter permease [Chloroflexota bacterium]